jgi:hypothetical protein
VRSSARLRHSIFANSDYGQRSRPAEPGWRDSSAREVCRPPVYGGNDDTGKVTSVVLHQGGGDVKGTRKRSDECDRNSQRRQVSLRSARAVDDLVLLGRRCVRGVAGEINRAGRRGLPNSAQLVAKTRIIRARRKFFDRVHGHNVFTAIDGCDAIRRKSLHGGILVVSIEGDGSPGTLPAGNDPRHRAGRAGPVIRRACPRSNHEARTTIRERDPRAPEQAGLSA